ncbi:hypothetical protein L3V82_09465 [Thiotrichales bacterium 19S3-7]|nr:hypothetical protein [Thiotrichales bacterium 19S3-7]MCF6802385.1 hypothetical protein [Thiotrichales bacterium 19S3-11]
MQEILGNYPDDAMGYLIDDQTKQIDSVHALGNSNLKGFDINCAHNLQALMKLITGDEVGFNNLYDYQREQLIKDFPEGIGDKEQRLLDKIYGDIIWNYQVYASSNYSPELNLTKQYHESIKYLMRKWPDIQQADIKVASKLAFGVEDIYSVSTNTVISSQLKNYMIQYDVIAKLKDILRNTEIKCIPETLNPNEHLPHDRISIFRHNFFTSEKNVNAQLKNEVMAVLKRYDSNSNNLKFKVSTFMNNPSKLFYYNRNETSISCGGSLSNSQ